VWDKVFVGSGDHISALTIIFSERTLLLSGRTFCHAMQLQWDIQIDCSWRGLTPVNVEWRINEIVHPPTSPLPMIARETKQLAHIVFDFL
jgi:hypothetical protein